MSKKRTALLIAREAQREISKQWGITAKEIGYTHTMRSAEAYEKENYAKAAWDVSPGSLPSGLTLTDEIKAIFREPKRGYKVHVVVFAQFDSHSRGEQWISLNRVATEPDGFVLAINDKLNDIAKGERGRQFDYDEFFALVRLSVDVFVWHNKKKKPTTKRKVKNPGSIKGMHT